MRTYDLARVAAVVATCHGQPDQVAIALRHVDDDGLRSLLAAGYAPAIARAVRAERARRAFALIRSDLQGAAR